MKRHPIHFILPSFLAVVSSSIAAEPETSFADPAIIKDYNATREVMMKFGSKEAPVTIDGAFRLTTYNIENLFDAHDDPALSGRDDDKDEAKPEHELIATAIAIREVNADVLMAMSEKVFLLSGISEEGAEEAKKD